MKRILCLLAATLYLGGAVTADAQSCSAPSPAVRLAGSSAISVDGTQIINPYFSSTTPGADTGYTQGKFKVSGSNVAVECPASGGAPVSQINAGTVTHTGGSLVPTTKPLIYGAGAADIAADTGATTDGAGNITTTGTFAVGTTCPSGAIGVCAPNVIVNVAQRGAKCDGVTDDTIAIQTVLNLGGNIQFPQGQTCLVTASPVIGSNTWLNLNQGTLYFPTSTGTVLVNASYASTPTTVSDGAMTNGSTTLTSATAGFSLASVGLSAYVVGANVADVEAATLFATITGYTNATTVTLSTPAWQTVSGAVVKFYNRDHDIQVTNGTIQGGIGAFSRNGNRNNIFHRVDRLTFRDVTLSESTGEWSLWMADVTHVLTDRIYCNNTVADCIDLIGPASDVALLHTHGETGDDLIALAGHASNADPIGDSVYGPITRVLVQDTSGTGSQLTVRIETGTAQASMTNISVLDTTQLKSGGIEIIDSDFTGAVVGACTADNIVIDRVFSDGILGTGPVNAVCANGGSLTISHVFSRNSAAGSNGTGIILGENWKTVTIDTPDIGEVAGTAYAGILLNAGSTFGSLAINNAKFSSSGSVSSGQFLSVKAASIGHLTGSKWYINGTNASGGINAITTWSTITTAIGKVDIDGQMDCASSSGCNFFVGNSPGVISDLRLKGQFFPGTTATSYFLTTGATSNVSRFGIINSHQESGSALLSLAGTVGPGDLTGTSIHAAPRLASTTTALDIALNGVTLDSLTSGAIASNNAAVIVRGSGIRCIGTCTTGFSNTGGTPTFHAINFDLRTDASTLAQAIGDRVYNTNSSFAPVGPLVSDGSAWQVAYNAGGVSNSVIHQDPVSASLTGTGSYQTMYTGTLPRLATGQCVDVTAYWYRVSGSGSNYIQWTVTDGTTPASLATAAYTVTGTGMSKSVAHVCNKQGSTTAQLFWVDPVQTSSALQLIGTGTSPAWNTSTATLTWTVLMNPIASDTYKLWYATTGVPY
jgi:hypothetical protein